MFFILLRIKMPYLQLVQLIHLLLL